VRTFEFREGSSSKFWNIELQGKQFTVTFGRIGTQGQTQVKEFPNAASAQAARDELVREKLNKGYVETTGRPTTSAAGSAAPAPLQESLERALVENPEDLTAHSAYADYLMEQSDSRGEFIQVQLALEDARRSRRTRRTRAAREGAAEAIRPALAGRRGTFPAQQQVERPGQPVSLRVPPRLARSGSHPRLGGR
jgi:uncharacterized protein (TIGR02996 family)